MGWFVARTECRVCGQTDLSVFPAEADETALECSRCHAMSSEATEYFPPDVRFHAITGKLEPKGEGPPADQEGYA